MNLEEMLNQINQDGSQESSEQFEEEVKEVKDRIIPIELSLDAIDQMSIFHAILSAVYRAPDTDIQMMVMAMTMSPKAVLSLMDRIKSHYDQLTAKDQMRRLKHEKCWALLMSILLHNIKCHHKVSQPCEAVQPPVIT